MYRLILLTATLLMTLSVDTSAHAEKLVLPVSMEGIDRDEHRGKATEPRSAKSTDQLEELLGEADAAKLKGQIDFATHYFVLFQWAGSGQDRITAVINDDTVIFKYKRGRTKDLRQHRQACAVKKGMEWKVELLGEEQVKPYDGRCEAPCPPETIASLMDEVIENHAGNVTLTLVRHPRPSSQPADARAAWVCMADGRPLWVIAKVLRASESKSSGITARAILRAREFVAEKEEVKRELGGKETPRNWHPKKEALLSAYQIKEYGLQITEIKLIDRKTESWKVTAKPIKDCLGGEIWMRFDKGHEVSAEYGK